MLGGGIGHAENVLHERRDDPHHQRIAAIWIEVDGRYPGLDGQPCESLCRDAVDGVFHVAHGLTYFVVAFLSQTLTAAESAGIGGIVLSIKPKQLGIRVCLRESGEGGCSCGSGGSGG
jgi:hypothetical protein